MQVLHKPVPPYLRVGVIVALIGSVAVLQYALASESASTPRPRETVEATLPTGGDIHRAELEYNQETLTLALEFGFDPMIVQVTRRVVADLIERIDRVEDPLTWRFIDTEPELTYLILSMIQAESRGDVAARGDSGDAYGLLQLHLPTAREYRPEVTGRELLTLDTHLEVAVEHFADLLRSYSGNYTLAVLAWNRGEGTIDRLLALGETPANGYARRVFAEAAVRNVGYSERIGHGGNP
jgi:hypothetical protein